MLRSAFCVALVAIALGGCARSGDLGRNRTDFISSNVLMPIDRYLLAGGTTELSNLPQTDEERRMTDIIWRFFTAPHARDWFLLGTPRVNPADLASGKAFEKTDRYYAHLRGTNFQSSRARYASVASAISADVGTLGSAFAAICAVRKLDSQRQTAAGAFPELGEEEHRQLQMRLDENAHAIASFALALEYRHQSYTYALKRLLVESPDEAALQVDAGLSELATRVDEARNADYCGPGV